MRTLFAAVALAAALPALAQQAEPSAQTSGDMMDAWNPPKLTNPERTKKEILAVLKKWDDIGKKGNVEAAADHLAFPVLMLTDDSKGQAMGETWTREQWVEMMKPFYAEPMQLEVRHQPTVFLISDSLASVDDVFTIAMGKKKKTGRNSLLLARIDGQWRVKAMVEGGWGDMGGAPPEPAGDAPAQPPAK